MKRKPYQEINLNRVLWGDNFFPYEHRIEDDKEFIGLKSDTAAAVCPHCGQESRLINGTFYRTIQDIPSGGRTRCLKVTGREFVCTNEACKAGTFHEQLPFAHGRQRRTDRLNELILAVAILTSNEGASQVLKLLGILVSNDSIQRLLDRVEIPDDPDVTVVGVDDVAVRKGHRYATVVYREADRQLLALLDGRDADPLRTWLKGHPKVQRIARDRASAYAQAISDVLPDCEQTADRFHLLQNLIDRLRVVFRESDLPAVIWAENGQLTEKPSRSEAENHEWKEISKDTSGLDYDNSVPTDENGDPIDVDLTRRGPSRKRAGTAKRKKKRKSSGA